MDVKISKSDLNRAERMLSGIKSGFPKAFKRTLDKTATGTKTDMVAFVRERYNYKAKALRERITVYKCPSYKHLKSSIRSVGPGVHLTDIAQTRQTGRGVTVNVKKATGRKLIPHAFIAPGRHSGKKIVFIRETIRGKRVSRYPISPIYASHPEVVYSTDENWPKIERLADARFRNNFDHEVEVVLKGIA